MIHISDLDKNFLGRPWPGNAKIRWQNGFEQPFTVNGLVPSQTGRYHRLPDELIDNVNEGVTVLATHTAGGRIRFRTDSNVFAIRVKPLYAKLGTHMPLTGVTGCDLYTDGVYRMTYIPPEPDGAVYEGIFEKEPKMCDITINLPLYNGVAAIWIGLDESSRVAPPTPYMVEKPLLFYGSSITQGGCASRPGNSYPALLARWLNADHINLGFSGHGFGEAVVAEYIGKLAISAFILDYDHNAKSPEHLLNTHERFFKIVREAQPCLPIIMISKPDTDFHPDYKERRGIIYETYKNAVAAGDANVYFIDGETLFGNRNRDACTVDGVHPNDLGFMRMAEGIFPILNRALGDYTGNDKTRVDIG